MKRVIIFSDGGCRPNPGVGAWAAVLQYNGHCKELVGGEEHTTNNRMELLAAIQAIQALKEPCHVHLHTDSEYVQKGITLWMPGWKRTNWRRGKRSEVKNLDLWRRLDELIHQHDIEWVWVRGHAGEPGNERCDELCTREIDRIYDEKLKAAGW